MDQKLNPIQPPPSVDDLLALGTDSRVGQVDFANPITSSTDPEGQIEDSSAAPVARVTSELPRRPVQVAPEPVAEVAAEVEREPGPEVEIEAAPAGLAPRARAKPAAKSTRTVSPRPAATATPQTAARMQPGDDVDHTSRLGEPSRAPEDLGPLGGTVQEVADHAIERLRDAETATLRHLRALEVEAARRTELITAQAELDAELIRITARREAHAIISAARTQAGLGGLSAREGRQLAEISDAVSHFAESIESSLAPMRSEYDQGDQ